MKLYFTLRRWHLLIAFLGIRRKAIILAFMSDFIANLCLVGMSLLLAQAVAVIFNFRSVRGSLLGLQDLTQGQLLVCFTAVAALKLLLDGLRFRLRGQLSEDFAHTLRVKAFGHHLRNDLQYHESRDSGHSLLRFGGDLGSVQQLLARGVLQYAADLSLLLLGLGLIAYIAYPLALVVLGAVLIAALVGHWYRGRLRAVESARRSNKSGLLAFVNTTLLHLSGIQALNRSTRTEQNFERKARRVRDWGHQYHALAAWQAAIPPFFSQILLVAILFFGGMMTIKPTALFAVVLILMTWRSPLSRLLRVGLVWEKGILSLEKFERLLQTPVVSEGVQKLKKSGHHILEVEHINFSFGKKKVLENLSFQMELGQKNTIRLPNGGGKTTLVKILAGLYRPDTGQIKWDGISMNTLAVHEIRRLVSFVSDVFPLTGNTLLDALSPSGQADALAATREAFDQFQTLFPQLAGIEVSQKIGGRALALSTGQHRLLQCLRSILTDKPWLVLDDPYAGLDDVTKQTLGNYLQKNTTHKGVLVLGTASMRGFDTDENNFEFNKSLCGNIV